MKGGQCQTSFIGNCNSPSLLTSSKNASIKRKKKKGTERKKEREKKKDNYPKICNLPKLHSQSPQPLPGDGKGFWLLFRELLVN